MATNHPIENGSGVQINDIRFNSTKTRLEVFEISSGTVLDSISLENYEGLHIDNNTIVVSDGISRTTSYSTGPIGTAGISLQKNGSQYNIIIVDGLIYSVVPGADGVNIRSDDPKMYYRT